MKKAEVGIILLILQGVLFWILQLPPTIILLIFFLPILILFYAIMGTMIFIDIKAKAVKSAPGEGFGAKKYDCRHDGVFDICCNVEVDCPAYLSCNCISYNKFLNSKNRSLVYARILNRAAIIGGGFVKNLREE